MADSTQGTSISTKVRDGAVFGGLVTALFVLAGLFGIELPESVTEEWLLEVIGAVIFLVTSVMKLIEYFRPERNPSRSAIDTAIGSMVD